MFQLLAFLLLIIAVSSQQQCQLLGNSVLDQNIPNLQTGLVSIEHQDGQFSENRFHNYNVSLKITLKKYIQVALSIVHIQDYCPEGIDFTVRPIINGLSSFTIAFVISRQSIWSKAHTNYLVTDRSDFRAGFFIPDDSRLLGFNQQETSIKNHRMKHSLSLKNFDSIFTEQKVGQIIFLSGIKTQDDYFNLDISGNDFDSEEKTLSFNVSATEIQQPIQMLYISYLLFINQDQIRAEFISEIHSHIQQIVQKNQEISFTGMTAVEGQEIKLLKQCKNNRRLLISGSEKIQKFTGSFDIIGIKIIDNLNNSLPFSGIPVSLSPNQKQLINNNCLDRKVCQDWQGKVVKFANSSSACVLCSQDEYYNYTQEKCVCLENKYYDGNKCISQQQKCGEGGILKNGQCLKCQVLTLQEPQCSQQMGYELVRVNNQQKCLKKCPGIGISQRNQLGDCQCLLSHQYIDSENNQCVSCPPKKKWDMSENKCVCRPPFKQKNDGSCVYCSVNAFFDEEWKNCFCKQGYQGNGSICRQSKILLGSGIISLQQENNN